MPTTPRLSDAEPFEESSTTPATAPLPPTPPRMVAPTRSKWVLSSIAGAGLLIIGLLGGMLIGQQMTPIGLHNGNVPSMMFMEHGGPGQHQRSPGEMKQNIKDHLHERAQQLRDRQVKPGQKSPSPSATPPAG